MRKKISTQYYENHMLAVNEIEKLRKMKWCDKYLREKWAEKFEVKFKIPKFKYKFIEEFLKKVGWLDFEEQVYETKTYGEASMKHLVDCALLEAKSILYADACDAKWGAETRLKEEPPEIKVVGIAEEE